ncbi:hypothetical protein OAK51_02615 [Alphaproteobacteria bacterium]|nr:hypothetical protein [Alphaproteobacteria bacterium]
MKWCALNQLSVAIYSMKSMSVEQINKPISVVVSVVTWVVHVLYSPLQSTFEMAENM